MTVRSAGPQDMDSIYMMGFDAWGEGQPENEYLTGCRDSEKYRLGDWYCLGIDKAKDKELVSSLIIYKNCFSLADQYCGIGSIATCLNHRRQGYAGNIIESCISNLTAANYSGVFLFSEVGASYYEKFGFTVVKRKKEVTLMFLSLNNGKLPELPSYF